MHLLRLQCTECGRQAAADRPQTVCASCKRPLAAVYDLDHVRRSVARADIERRPGGLWRYAEVLPLPDPGRAVTLGEGGTPLLRLPRLGERLGLAELYLKDEALNPTGSFKARGMSVAVSMAARFGARVLSAPSAGNAGGALAAYGARAGLEVVLAMPRDVPRSNLLEARACGARVELVDGTIADCGRWIAERAAREGWVDVSTLKEPYRVEGKKTLGYELAEDLGWRLPDVILYPTGGGTGLVGMDKAFGELRELGWIDAAARAPRFVVVQASGCAPIADAWHAGTGDLLPPASPRTVAAGLRVPRPIGDRWMLRVLRASAGRAVSVGDEALLAGSMDLARTEGIFAAPETGALVAALTELQRARWIAPEETVVLFSTGAGIKYGEAFDQVLLQA